MSPNYPNKSLCGVGMIYKLLMVMDELLNSPNHCRKFLDLCALGNIADCMSMKEPETRYYISEGLKQINNQCFKELINKQNYVLFKEEKELYFTNIAFYIAPLINALIRVGTQEEKELLFRAFTTPNELISSNMRGSKGKLVCATEELVSVAAAAKRRQDKIRETATASLENLLYKYDLLENKILIIEVDSEEIPQEMRGLICAQFVNRFHRPCAIVVRNEEGFLRGSMRGNASFSEVPDFKKFLEDSGFVEYVQG